MIAMKLHTLSAFTVASLPKNAATTLPKLYPLFASSQSVQMRLPQSRVQYTGEATGASFTCGYPFYVCPPCKSRRTAAYILPDRQHFTHCITLLMLCCLYRTTYNAGVSHACQLETSPLLLFAIARSQIT